MPKLTLKPLLLTGLLACLALLAGCGQSDLLGEVRERGVLKVVTRNGPTTYYESRYGPAGFEYELAAELAAELGVELEIIVTHSFDAMFETLEKGAADIACAGISITPERQQRLLFSNPYLDVEQLVLYRAGGERPADIQDLVGRNIRVMAGSSHSETLGRLREQLPALSWDESRDVETIDLLDQLIAGELDLTVIDSNEFIANKSFYPRLRRAFVLGESNQLAWALRRAPQSESLLTKVDAFLARLRESGELDQLLERHYSHSEDKTWIAARTFHDNVASRLPRYRELIENIANEYDLDWRLLAAISYQESLWNPRARSPTGVRGMMMLTLPTAKDLGIRNRLDAEQSLRGGARYFKQIHRRLPERLDEPDRTWFALAAYNIGLGHLEDARKITQAQGANPDRWADVKRYLPWLRKKQWYRQTTHGYARGSEAVLYVQNIRHYYNLLTWGELAEERRRPPTDFDRFLPEILKDTELKSL
ncbi:MAG: membrane-bound lytic murein transglycosylase MltF [Spongiibacteraceae bacterium]|jgi:membrane-bound lytic murein transglycosylase F|nr:membrane-bound lytic murein transglycosylase MltF [Spongiibacteraceae bacterium]